LNGVVLGSNPIPATKISEFKRRSQPLRRLRLCDQTSPMTAVFIFIRSEQVEPLSW
jgi:hypothetical protein